MEVKYFDIGGPFEVVPDIWLAGAVEFIIKETTIREITTITASITRYSIVP